MSVQSATDDLVASIKNAFTTKIYKDDDSLVSVSTKVLDLGDVTGIVTLDFRLATEFKIRLTGNATIIYEGVPPPGVTNTYRAYLRVTRQGSQTINFSGARFPDGTPPTLSNGEDVFEITWNIADQVPEVYPIATNVS